MRVEHGPFKSWNTCSQCGYQGLFVFHCRADEDYDDPHLLAAMMDTQCPACEAVEALLVSAQEFRDMQSLLASRSE